MSPLREVKIPRRENAEKFSGIGRLRPVTLQIVNAR
jgi:hypothetical protein